MYKILLAVISLAAIGAGGYYLYAQKGAPVGEVFCTQEAKLCPDGVTYVGRQGPNCEFAACPTPDTSGEIGIISVDAKIGSTARAFGITIKPLEVLEDSRCPLDVQCIQAGTVRLKVEIESGMGKSTMTLTLGEPATTEAEQITLSQVSPAPNSKIEIKDADYRFIFDVEKR